MALLLEGLPARLFAAVAGSGVTVLAVFWLVGDVKSLRWAWGAVAEEQTADVLADLPRHQWTVVHDVLRPGGRGNWDHIAVSRAGVFLIETRVLTGVAQAGGDALRAGRLRYEGAALRAAAAALAGQLGTRSGKPWVQAVVAIWGAFPQRRHVEGNIVYLASHELPGWLAEQPERLTLPRAEELAKTLLNTLASRT